MWQSPPPLSRNLNPNTQLGSHKLRNITTTSNYVLEIESKKKNCDYCHYEGRSRDLNAMELDVEAIWAAEG